MRRQSDEMLCRKAGGSLPYPEQRLPDRRGNGAVVDRQRSQSYYDSVTHHRLHAMPRTNRPITVTLGDLKQRVDARVQSGAFASASEVLRAALRALDREEAAVTDWLRVRVDEAFADPRPNRPGREVFRRLHAYHAKQVKADKDEAV